MTTQLNERMEPEHVVEIHPDGSVTDGPAGVYAPEVSVDLDDDFLLLTVPLAALWLGHFLLSGAMGFLFS